MVLNILSNLFFTISCTNGTVKCKEKVLPNNFNVLLILFSGLNSKALHFVKWTTNVTKMGLLVQSFLFCKKQKQQKQHVK